MKPMIGVVPLWDDEKESYWMLPGYLKGIENAGGIPVMLPMTANEQDLRQLADICDGFLFTGGHDVDPVFYGEVPLPVCGSLCAERDCMEKKLFDIALEKDRAVQWHPEFSCVTDDNSRKILEAFVKAAGQSDAG